MMPLNAVWIDSDREFVDSMRILLENKLEGVFFIHYLSSWSKETSGAVIWSEIDVVLADLNIHEEGLFQIVPEIRNHKVNVPVVLVTTQSDKNILIQAINSGVNGFAEKTQDVILLKGLLEKYRAKGFELRMNSDRKAIYSQGKWVDLTSTEYKIIETLRNEKRRLTRTELQSAVWPNSSISENNLDTHLTNLKRKIPELGGCLNVKRGLGYYLDTKTI